MVDNGNDIAALPFHATLPDYVVPPLPPIAPAAGVTTADVVQEADHLREVKSMRLVSGQPLITRLEEEEAEMRLSKVRAKAAGAAAPPTWGASVLDQIVVLNNTVAVMGTDMNNRFAALGNQLAARNTRALVWNSRGGLIELLPLVKEQAGLGARPAWAPPGFRDPRFNPTVPVVGSLPPTSRSTTFPRTITELDALTEANFADLTMFYNDDFGIFAGNDLRTKRAKFAAFIGITYSADQTQQIGLDLDEEEDLDLKSPKKRRKQYHRTARIIHQLDLDRNFMGSILRFGIPISTRDVNTLTMYQNVVILNCIGFTTLPLVSVLAIALPL
ncbi:hypothetical protein DFS34DRAFT_597039 [Phlyctochytrium arcticum]|nr:hypothetical protein DFS34DRAFT_597039 [Phlyctochytrium arcticum]